MNYTTVVGVDRFHLEQLSLTWPTWKKHKPSLLDQPMVVFYDLTQVTRDDVCRVVDHPNLRVEAWPMRGVDYGTDNGDKWSKPQRYKMLAGFVYVPMWSVETTYFLKIDTDTVAYGNNDWINPEWFEDDPVIVSHSWSFTKPPDQMLLLDEWVAEIKHVLGHLSSREPLNLVPRPGASRLGHRRIISWCGFFKRDLASDCAVLAANTVGLGLLPCQSQDGFMWYVAKRMGYGIRRTNMKRRGWGHWSTMFNVRKESAKAMQC